MSTLTQRSTGLVPPLSLGRALPPRARALRRAPVGGAL